VRVLARARRRRDPLAEAVGADLAVFRRVRRRDLEPEAQLHLQPLAQLRHLALELRLVDVAVARDEHRVRVRALARLSSASEQAEKGSAEPDDAPPANHAL